MSYHLIFLRTLHELLGSTFFSKKDTMGINPSDNDPLIITIQHDNWDVIRVLIVPKSQPMSCSRMFSRSYNWIKTTYSVSQAHWQDYYGNNAYNVPCGPENQQWRGNWCQNHQLQLPHHRCRITLQNHPWGPDHQCFCGGRVHPIFNPEISTPLGNSGHHLWWSTNGLRVLYEHPRDNQRIPFLIDARTSEVQNTHSEQTLIYSFGPLRHVRDIHQIREPSPFHPSIFHGIST